MRKGSHQSEEAKQKISKSMIEVRKTINPMKGRTGERHQNFGKHWNAEVRKKMSDAKKGKPGNRKGIKHSDETKQKISESKKGSIPWNKGLKTGPETNEHKQNISIGILDWWKDLPEDVILTRNRKISESKQGKLDYLNFFGQYYINLDGQQIWLRSSYEVRIATILDKLLIKWYYEPRSFDLGNHFYHPDFYLPEYDIWWEVKGWLSEKDKQKLIKFSVVYPNINIKLIFLNHIKILENESNKEHIKEFGILINNI